jgi:hypothetical protein
MEPDGARGRHPRARKREGSRAAGGRLSFVFSYVFYLGWARPGQGELPRAAYGLVEVGGTVNEIGLYST